MPSIVFSCMRSCVFVRACRHGSAADISMSADCGRKLTGAQLPARAHVCSAPGPSARSGYGRGAPRSRGRTCPRTKTQDSIQGIWAPEILPRPEWSGPLGAPASRRTGFYPNASYQPYSLCSGRWSLSAPLRPFRALRMRPLTTSRSPPSHPFPAAAPRWGGNPGQWRPSLCGAWDV